MSSETLSYFFKNEDIKLKARFQVALQCAPFLKGLKISSVITMEQKMCEELQEIFEETEVEYRILSCRDSRCLVFFFRRSELEYHLMLPDNQRLLELNIKVLGIHYVSLCVFQAHNHLTQASATVCTTQIHQRQGRFNQCLAGVLIQQLLLLGKHIRI